jgi:hypothetical protein
LTAFFIFELRTLIEAEVVRAKVLGLWLRPQYRFGFSVDVYSQAKNGTLICDVLYYFSPDEEDRSRIERILDYLFDIALDGRVYYYRFDEATDMYWSAKQKLGIEHLFGDYCPNLGGCPLRYELVRPRLKAQQNNSDRAD